MAGASRAAGFAQAQGHTRSGGLASDGALWRAITAHALLPDTVIISDDAGQFDVGGPCKGSTIPVCRN
jgi:hypothetical protein